MNIQTLVLLRQISEQPGQNVTLSFLYPQVYIPWEKVIEAVNASGACAATIEFRPNTDGRYTALKIAFISFIRGEPLGDVLEAIKQKLNRSIPF